MNYETALKLKNAGFPQTTPSGNYRNGHYIVEGKETCYDPTLEELIEGCGEGFDRLWKVDKSYDGGNTKWCATGSNDFNDGCGPTPSEAVANLYLALNKKS